MGTKTFMVHDGKIFETIVGEEIFTNDGKPTGHYKEISREQTGVLGILDNNEIKQKFISDVFKVSNYNQNYVIMNDKYFFTINRQTIYHAKPTVCSSVSNALITIIMNIGYLQSYEVLENKILLHIIEKDKKDNSQTTLMFIPYDNFTYLANSPN